MGGTGKVVTNAGLVFAFTMAAMVVSDLRIIGQVGSTIGLGLLFDTLDRALVHDAVDRRFARTLVLVPASSAPSPGQSDASACGTAPTGAVIAAKGGGPRRRRGHHRTAESVRPDAGFASFAILIAAMSPSLQAAREDERAWATTNLALAAAGRRCGNSTNASSILAT